MPNSVAQEQKNNYPKNELAMDLLGLGSLGPWIAHNSSSRLQMYCGHIGSSLSVVGRTPRRCVTGMEREYGKYTFSIKMPVNASIIRLVERYPKRPGSGFIAENPQTIVIYEDTETKKVGCLELKNFHSIHQHFGFNYVKKPEAMDKLYRGSSIKKGTILADSPSVDDDGNYMLGIETEVAFMAVPAVIEDGVVISDDYARRLTTKAYGTRIIKWGKSHYPLNLYSDYGNDGVYKPFPDIGERIRPDGLLFALRAHNELRSVVEMTQDALKEPDYIFDKLTYAEPNAKIVDIRVYYDKHGKTTTPVGMETQPMKYVDASSRFYEAIWSEYCRLKASRKDDLQITPEFHRLLVEAQADTGLFQDNRVMKTHRMAPLDDFRIEITFEYDLVPTIGYKLTGSAGDKGIICGVEPVENMPIDANGNRADAIMDPISTIKRMNIGRMYEQYINACSRDVSERVRQMMGIHPKEPEEDKVEAVIHNPTLVQQAWEYLLGYYKLVSPPMFDAITSVEYEAYARNFQLKQHDKNPYQSLVQTEELSKEQIHLRSVLLNGIYLWLPTNNPKPSAEIVRDLKKHYPPVFGPIKYRGKSGREVVTKNPVLIGSIYVLLLDKTGGNWAAVASAKLQHFGTPAKLTNNDKYSAPGRLQPVRYTGEAEGRSFGASIGADAAADILDQSNNPQVHKAIARHILTADKPTAIQHIVDRSKFPRGNGRPLVFVKHQLQCGGWRLVRKEK